jgi:hypothetical protein
VANVFDVTVQAIVDDELLQDYRGLKKVLLDSAPENTVPILNAESYPLPTTELVIHADWPKKRTILGRGLLALQLKCGPKTFGRGEGELGSHHFEGTPTGRPPFVSLVDP